MVLVQRGWPRSPALAASASFCWMWYSWKRIEIRWVIFRYFWRHDSEQLDWETQIKPIPGNEQVTTSWQNQNHHTPGVIIGWLVRQPRENGDIM